MSWLKSHPIMYFFKLRIYCNTERTVKTIFVIIVDKVSQLKYKSLLTVEFIIIAAEDLFPKSD